MVNSIFIGKVIYNILSTNSLLTPLVGNKIYPLVAEQTTEYPFIVYFRDNITNKTYTKDGYCEDLVTFTINCVSTDYSEGLEIANEVRKCLEKRKIESEYMTIFNCRINSIDESFTDNAYVQTLSFTCTIE